MQSTGVHTLSIGSTGVKGKRGTHLSYMCLMPAAGFFLPLFPPIHPNASRRRRRFTPPLPRSTRRLPAHRHAAAATLCTPARSRAPLARAVSPAPPVHSRCSRRLRAPPVHLRRLCTSTAHADAHEAVHPRHTPQPRLHATRRSHSTHSRLAHQVFEFLPV